MKKIKKLTAVFLAVIMALSVLTVAPFTVSAATYGDYEYRLEDDYTCTITKYNGSATNVTIPSTIYGNKVAKISGFANTNVVNVVIPNGVKEINYGNYSGCFAGCKNLKSIVLPNTLQKLDFDLFSGCSSLESINIPDSVKIIDSYAFENCSNLKSIKFSKNILEIDDYAFAGCSKINSITIPNSVKKIGKRVFSGCIDLATVTFGSGLENIGVEIFDSFNYWDYCKKLESIIVNQNNIHFSSFNGVLFDKKKTEIIWYPQGKKNTSYIVPNSVRSIYKDTFVNTSYLKTATIYDNVTEISDSSIGYMRDGWHYNKVNGFTIKGYKGTEAEKYARNNDFNFVALPKPVNPTSVSISTNSIILGAGESTTLTAKIQPSNAVKTLTWSSSNTSVATVSNGKVTAKKSGTANITVKTSNGKTATCKVTVKPAPTSVKTNPASVTLGVGEKYTISESTNSGTYANASNLKWSTSNSSVATVTKGSGNKATVTAKGVGTAYVKITLYNGKTAQCKVTVKPAPTSVKSYPASVTLGKGENYTIAAGTNSGSWSTTYTWSSSNNSVATVTGTTANKAKITAKGTGTATITIRTFNGKTATCKVTVKNAPSSVKVNPSNITLKKGASYTISESTNSGTYANADNLKWSTSNSSVATVKKGSGNKATITAKSKGTAYIKITLYNGKTAQCKVTVK